MRQFNQKELVEKIRSERRHMNELYAQISELKQENTNLKDYVKSLKDECISCPEDTKQAQINVLNKVKEQLFFGVSLGFLRLYVDELIKEIEK